MNNYSSIFKITNKDSSYLVFEDSIYTPHLSLEQPVLYLFEKQEKMVSKYLGGYPTSEEINREHAGKVWKYMEFNYGHWGG